MSRRIIGNTVGSTLPKPNLMQDDPKKGDYVYGKDAIPTKVSQLENDSKYLEETKLPNVINEALVQAKESGEFTVDTAEVVEAVLDEIPKASSLSFVRSGNTITATIPLDNGSTSTSIITLDEDGCPTNVTTDGVACPVSWEGFDE